MTTEVEQDSVVLVEVTIAYPALFEPRVPKGSASDAAPTYQVTVLLPPNYDLGPLAKLVTTVATKAFGSNAVAMLQAGAIKSPFRNQAEKAAQGKEGYSNDPAAKYINCKSERQPGVVDQKLQPVLDPSKVYGGKICNVQVNAFPWSHPTGGKGVSLGLQNVQLVKDGPKLGNQNPDPASVFKPIAAPEEGSKSDEAVAALFR